MSKLEKFAVIATCLLGLAGGFVTINTVRADITSSNPFPYSVETRPNGYLRVYVNPDLRDSSQRESYASAQLTAISNLLAAGQTEDVTLQVTFSQPIAVEELRDLSNRTGLLSEHVILAARDDKDQLHAIGQRAIPSAIVNTDELNAELNSRGLRLLGVAVIRGRVVGGALGLGQLANDPRIHLVDVTPHILAKEVATKQGVSVDKVQISVPSPYWDLISNGK